MHNNRALGAPKRAWPFVAKEHVDHLADAQPPHPKVAALLSGRYGQHHVEAVRVREPQLGRLVPLFGPVLLRVALGHQFPWYPIGVAQPRTGPPSQYPLVRPLSLLGQATRPVGRRRLAV